MSRNADCDALATLDVINQVVPCASLKSDASGEIVVNLPDTQIHRFAELFETLDREKERLGVLNFGLSVTTMEDVFLRVGSMAEKDVCATGEPGNGGGGGEGGAAPGHRRELSLSSFQSQLSNSPSKRLVTERLKGLSLWRTRMWGLLVKRVIYASRRWILYTVMVCKCPSSGM